MRVRRSQAAARRSNSILPSRPSRGGPPPPGWPGFSRGIGWRETRFQAGRRYLPAARESPRPPGLCRRPCWEPGRFLPPVRESDRPPGRVVARFAASMPKRRRRRWSRHPRPIWRPPPGRGRSREKQPRDRNRPNAGQRASGGGTGPSPPLGAAKSRSAHSKLYLSLSRAPATWSAGFPSPSDAP